MSILPLNNNNIYFDNHTHSENSHDSTCRVESMCEAAISRGISGISVTDHCDIEFAGQLNLSEIMNGSYNDARKAAEKYAGKLEVLAGIEICETFWNTKETEKILKQHDYDVILGSVHAVRYKDYTIPYSQIDFSEMSDNMIDEFMSAYFDDMICMLESTYFNVLAHLTCPIRYISGKYGRAVCLDNYMNKIEKILSFIIEKDIAIEINTSEIGKPYNDFMPQRFIIERFLKMGGRLISTGSDAHAAERSGNGFDRLYQMLSEIGVDTLCRFKGQKPQLYSINR